jgi:HEPN domain-containing protein
MCETIRCLIPVIPQYPGLAEPVTHEESFEAIKIAEAVINWVERIIG